MQSPRKATRTVSAGPLPTNGACVARRSLTILGATGSIGKSTLDLVERNPDAFEVVALTAQSNVAGLAEAARRTHARRAATAPSTISSIFSRAIGMRTTTAFRTR